jgi:superfamily II DNA or RNA helicase
VVKARPPVKLPADPLLLSAKLRQFAGHEAVLSGRQYALLGRVRALRLSPDGRRLDARVRGDRPTPYEVAVRVREDGRLAAQCACDGETDRLCKHAVAAVEALRFPLPAVDPSRRHQGRRRRGQGRILQHAPQAPGFVVLGAAERTLTREERIEIARAEELGDRRLRARRERARVERLRGRAGPLRLRVCGRRNGAAYVVTLRGAKAELPSCTCPDYAKNELGTCKHIERARSWLLRRRKGRRGEVLSVWWRPRVWTAELPDPWREIRVDLPSEELLRSLEAYFENDGWLRRPPDGQAPASFADKAIRAAERLARYYGRTWDLDPRLRGLLRRAASQWRLSRTLGALGKDGAAWTGIVPHLGFRLHPYQEQGVLFLARRGRAFLADDFGLGKTLQAIVAALLLRRAVGARRALVVCPASLKHQWRREIHRACGDDATVVDGRTTERAESYRAWRSGFCVLNYELALRDLERIRAARPDLVILDEAQRIKNWDTKTAKAVKQLDSPHAFVLTGTPLENRLGELHSLVEFLHPRALGPRWRLLPFHAVTDARGRVLAYEGFEALRERLRPFFLRRERREVLDQLPARTDHTYWTGMTPAQQRPYRKLARRVAALVKRGQPLRPGEVRALLRALTGMRILCNAWAQYAWSRFEGQVLSGAPATRAETRALESPKLEEFARLLEDLLEESGTKVVVFSQWERMLRLAQFVVRELLHRRGERAEVFHGGLMARARTRLLDEFREEPALRVLLSTDAGGQGLNLQEAASVVVNLEVPWNPAVLEQRVGRVHRIGQRHGVRVVHFVTRGAIEERVRQVVEAKRALFEGLLVEDADRVVLDAAGRATFVERVRQLIR